MHQYNEMTRGAQCSSPRWGIDAQDEYMAIVEDFEKGEFEMAKTKLYEVSLETPTQGLVFRVPVEATSAKEAREIVTKQEVGYTSDAFASCLKAKKVEQYEEE
jgi:RNA polymerase-interacting CarD/CdnL/TRCF family regulator